MPHERDQWIRDRAYALWEEAGRPDGQDGDHWRQATADWDEYSRQESGSAQARLPTEDEKTEILARAEGLSGSAGTSQ